MQARIIIQLVKTVCEHCPAEENSWQWYFHVAGDKRVELIILCKKCGAEIVIPNRQLRAQVQRPPENTAINYGDEPDPPPEPAPDAETERRQHSQPATINKAFTPSDREFLKRLKIATDDIEFQK